MKRFLFTVWIISLFSTCAFAQHCNCETELGYIKSYMERNYAGFEDKQAIITKAKYNQLVKSYLALAKAPYGNEECLIIIYRFLSAFKDHHVSVRATFDANKLDSAYISQRQIIPISDEKIAQLRKSTTFEGIYDFHDPARYKIAVIKDQTLLHDYIGIIVNSNLPGWKKGMIKFEAKMETDSLGKGVLYMLNGMPKLENFSFRKDAISGDWHREGTTPNRSAYNSKLVDAKKLTDKTLYIKVASFGTYNAKNVDSLLLANKENLNRMPNLVLDLRGNGGGADYVYRPLMPYMYTSPVRYRGTSIWATPDNIKGWKRYLEDDEMSAENKASIQKTIELLEANKGKWVNKTYDAILSNYEKLSEPSKVVILIDGNCASSTEEFLLFARQSTKVTLMGKNTSGTLDYSNVLEVPFSCMPYILRYSSSRSNRVIYGEGIDNTGIKPQYYLSDQDDWIEKAVVFLEK